MKKKSLIVVAVVVVILIAIVLVGNWYLGQRVEKAVSMRIYEELAAGDLGVSIRYDDISVNPLMRRVGFGDIELDFRDAEQSFLLGSLRVSLPLSDLITAARTGTLEELHGLKLDLQDFRVLFGNIDMFTLDRASVAIDGQLSQGDLENIENDFLKEKRRLKVAVHGAEMSPFLSQGLGSTTELLPVDNSIELLAFDLSVKPSSQTMELNSLELRTSEINLKASGDLFFSVDRRGGYLPQRTHYELDLRLTPGKREWPLDLIGPDDQFSVQELTLHTSSDYHFMATDFRSRIPQGEVDLAIKDLELVFGQQTRRTEEFRHLDAVKFEQIELSGQSDGERLQVRKALVRSTELNVDGELDIQFDEHDPDDSVIHEARLHITDISRKLHPLVASLEKDMGMSLLKGNEIDLHWEGTLGNPEVVSN
jgi:hypothetical protein